MQSFGSEKGFVIRPPATANLMVDSADRTNANTTTPFDFQITKSQAIFNGFFTRVGTTEVILEWCQDNIASANNTIQFDLSGVSQRETIYVDLGSGTYTVQDALEAIVDQLNENTVGAVFSIQQGAGTVFMDCSGAFFEVDNSVLANQLDIDNAEATEYETNQWQIPISCPDLRPTRYIDFVCEQLTYPQDLKDATTATNSRDVLCRWYFAEDTQEEYDGLGFPILMGYKRFCRRRLFNPPKQIKWDSNLPVGNLRFQLYGDNSQILNYISYGKTNWLMTLQLTEN